jgi:hypothetical protein
MDQRTRWLRNSLVVFLGFVAFAPTLRLGFQFDDHEYIESNLSLRQWDIAALKQDFLPGNQGPRGFYYRPLQSLLNRLQYTLWGLHPFGYHLTNLIVHLGNAVLVMELLIALSLSSWAAVATGSLFAVHPIIVSELMMVSGIPEIMGLFFSLLCLLLLLKKDRDATSLAALSYALALLSKESALAVPFYFALLDGFRSINPRRKRQWIVLLLLTTAYLVWHAHALGMPDVSLPARTLAAFFFSRLPVILYRYAGLVLFPWNLHAYRLIPGLNPLGAYGAVCLLIWGYAAGGKPSWARFCAVWGLISFIPKIPLLATGHYMLEHWAYPALPAVLLPLSVAFTRGWLSGKTAWRWTALAAFSFLLCFYIFSAQFHTAVRATDEKNYRWSLRFTRATPVLFNLGLICLKSGRAAEAVSYIEPVQALYPDDVNIRHALADAYVRAGRTAHD